jgi:protein-tyrosine-phosphatase
MADVLFVCVQNAGRSQMSAALFGRAAAGRHSGVSAGTDPGDHIHPEVVEAMRGVGIDLTDQRPQRLTTALVERADVVVTMGCGDACPVLPGKRYVAWDLPDPQGMASEDVRRLRDEIDAKVRALAEEL